MTETNVLEVTSLSVSLSGRQVLDRVGLTVEAGELIGLIGPNGAGKTTLLRAILGLVPHEQGQTLICGESSLRTRSRVGYVPQRHEFAWEFPMSVAQAVMTGRTRAIGWLRRPREADNRAVSRALDRVGLTQLRDSTLGELSGGQRQRVLLARALALEPPLMLLDEPFTAVDAPTQELLFSLLESFQQDGMAVVMTTHDLGAVVRSCSRIALLNGGRLREGDAGLLHDPALLLEALGLDAGPREKVAAGGAT